MIPAANSISTNSAFSSILEPTINQSRYLPLSVRSHRAKVPPVVSIPKLLAVSIVSLSIRYMLSRPRIAHLLEKDGYPMQSAPNIAFSPFLIKLLSNPAHCWINATLTYFDIPSYVCRSVQAQ
jgi:hypothetical protein